MVQVSEWVSAWIDLIKNETVLYNVDIDSWDGGDWDSKSTQGCEFYEQKKRGGGLIWSFEDIDIDAKFFISRNDRSTKLDSGFELNVIVMWCTVLCHFLLYIFELAIRMTWTSSSPRYRVSWPQSCKWKKNVFLNPMDLVSWHKLARKQGSKLKLASKSSWTCGSRINQTIAQLSHISICRIDMTHSFMGNVFLPLDILLTSGSGYWCEKNFLKMTHNGKSSSHQQSDWCRLIADWLQIDYRPFTSTVVSYLNQGYLTHTHRTRRCYCICCFKGLKHTWSTLGPRARLLVPHGLNPGFQVSLPFKCTLQWFRCHFLLG